MQRRRLITACAAGALACAAALAALLTGCAGPTPFKTGPEVAPPAGCADYRARGGAC